MPSKLSMSFMVVSSAKLISSIDLPKILNLDVQLSLIPSSITWNIVLLSRLKACYNNVFMI
nr:MAG TPA: hypothetical protein [Caudoviricetes sp.]